MGWLNCPEVSMNSLEKYDALKANAVWAFMWRCCAGAANKAAQICIVFFMAAPVVYANGLNFPNYPLIYNGIGYYPNILVVYDNSFSMDYQMDESNLIGGADPNSRSNITRNALRNILSMYRYEFNWGLEVFNTFGSIDVCTDDNGLCGNYTAYEGTSSTMVFTNDCVNGISASHGGLKCVTNPEPNGYNFLTYERGGGANSHSIIATYRKNWIWGKHAVGDSSGYLNDFFNCHNPAVTTWNSTDSESMTYNATNDFRDPFFGYNPVDFGDDCIDSSSDCSEALLPRQLYLKSGFVFMQEMNGKGKILKEISKTTDGVYQDLMAALAPETSDLSKKDIKNGAIETPLLGSFMTAKEYFSGALQGYLGPIQNSCQKSYVLLATDGQPTANASGNRYPDYQIDDAINGKAYKDLYAQIQLLRNLTVNSKSYDIKTYVLGIGDLITNPVGVTGLNKMAEYGGTTKAYFANDPTGVEKGFADIVAEIKGQVKPLRSNGRVAINTSFSVNDNSLYKAYYLSDGNKWSGNVIEFTPKMSVENNIVSYDTEDNINFTSGAAVWLVNEKIQGVTRQIITSSKENRGDVLAGVPFQWGNLKAESRMKLLTESELAIMGARRVGYVRGERDYERSASNPNGFRVRPNTVLGDIVDSSPVFVGRAVSGFSDDDFPADFPSYHNFAQSTESRVPMIYVGSNDGMLHGFNAKTMKEVFAYIPFSVTSKFVNFSNPGYTHDFFVNETPLVADVPLSDGWTTVLIGFPGVGGKGLFALNVGKSNLIEAEKNVNKIFLWEIDADKDDDIGYIINRGQVIRNRGGITQQIGRLSNKKWVVLTGNGYNSRSGKTGLIIAYLDAVGGQPSYKKIMAPIDTNGLSSPTPVDVDFDGAIDFVYAGDLKGNVWRFDLRGDEANWSVSRLFMFNPDWAPLPIMTAPAISFHCSKKGVLIVVGTGKYLEASDHSMEGSNYLMGIWDSLEAIVQPIRTEDMGNQWYYMSGDTFSNPEQNVPEFAKKLIMTSDNDIDWSVKKGWYLPVFDRYPYSSKIIAPPYIYNGHVYFNTMLPSAESCGIGKVLATSQAVNVCTGGRPRVAVFDTNFDGKVDDKDKYNLWGGDAVNVTGFSFNDQARVVDSSVWVDPRKLTCKDSSCLGVKTALSEVVGVDWYSERPLRATWREVPAQ